MKSRDQGGGGGLFEIKMRNGGWIDSGTTAGGLPRMVESCDGYAT